MKKLVLCLAVPAFALGCASTQPPRELVDARVAYNNAVRAPSANMAQTDLYEAKTSLDRAEKSFDDDGDSQSTRDFAYVAQRKAISAQAKAGTLEALQEKTLAENEFKNFRDQRGAMAQQQLNLTKEQLDAQKKAAESERTARAEAESKTRDALAKIQGLQTKLDERGLVLTLSGSVLFATGKSVLLPTAQTRLKEVATALKEQKSSIMIVGHTDSTGSAETNQKLSEDRAEAVKKYLVQQGIDDSQVKTEGMGPAQPIADNKTAEGRANNRRVEIILQKEGGAGANSEKAPNTPMNPPPPRPETPTMP